MFIRSNDEKNIVKNVEIELGTLVGLENDKDASVTFSLLNYGDAMGLKDALDKGSEAIALYLKEKLPNYVVSHNFWESENVLMSNDGVINFLYGITPTFLKISQAYLDKVFFTKEAVKV